MADINTNTFDDLTFDNTVVEVSTRDFPSTGSPDASPPTVTLVSPTAGSTILPTTSVVVDVTDPSGLAKVFLIAQYATGFPELVHDGTAFTVLYATSVRTAISAGYRYTITRTDGWPRSPTIRVIALDTKGNEA